jgi:hypothetical protein
LVMFVLICIGLVFLIVGSIFSSGGNKVEEKDGYFWLASSEGSNLLHVGFLIAVASAVFIATQAQNTPSMPNNTLWAFVVSTSFIGMGIYMMLEYFTVYGFNEDHLLIKKVGQTKQSYKWSELSEIGISNSRRFLKFTDSQKVYQPFGRNGLKQFQNAVELQSAALEKRIGAEFEIAEERLKALIGTKILVNIVYVQPDLLDKKPVRLVGVIDQFDCSKIEISFEHESLKLITSPNYKTVQPINMWMVQELTSEGIRPDQIPPLFCVWYTRIPKYSELKSNLV